MICYVILFYYVIFYIIILYLPRLLPLTRQDADLVQISNVVLCLNGKICSFCVKFKSTMICYSSQLCCIYKVIAK